MSHSYSKEDLENWRDALTPGIRKAKLVASMQIDAAIDLATEKGLGDDDATILALAQVIATNWARAD